MAVTPKQQYAKMAERIIAKRGRKAQAKAIELEVPEVPEVPEVDESSYIDMDKSDLKAIADKRGLKYKKKATRDDLEALIMADDDDSE